MVQLMTTRILSRKHSYINRPHCSLSSVQNSATETWNHTGNPRQEFCKVHTFVRAFMKDEYTHLNDTRKLITKPITRRSPRKTLHSLKSELVTTLLSSLPLLLTTPTACRNHSIAALNEMGTRLVTKLLNSIHDTKNFPKRKHILLAKLDL